MSEPAIAIVFTPEAWVEELHRHLTDHGGARVRALVMDPLVALEEDYHTLVVSHRWPALTRAFVADLHDRRRRVLGVYDREERAAAEMLQAIGVDRVLESDAGPRRFLESFILLEDGTSAEGKAAPVRVEAAAAGRGRLLVVRGPAGAGATEVALGLAGALAARRGARAGPVIVDADEVAPAVAPRLGLAPEPNLRNAVDAAEFGLGELADAVARVPGVRYGVVGGMPNVAMWSQVRPGEVLRVVHGLAAGGGDVVVDVAAPLDDVGASTRGRYAVARSVLGDADALVAVGVATPVGVVRLLTWLADARVVAPRLPVHVVVNRAPRDAFRRGELAEEIGRSFPAPSLTFVPFDRRVEAAAWAGSPVTRGPFSRAVARLSANLRELAASTPTFSRQVSAGQERET